MKKRIIASVLIVALMATCLLAFAACDKDEVPAEFEMPVGDRPDKASLISAEDQAIIDKGLAESAKDDDNDVSKYVRCEKVPASIIEEAKVDKD